MLGCGAAELAVAAERAQHVLVVHPVRQRAPAELGRSAPTSKPLDELRELIRLYQERVTQAVTLLKENLHLEELVNWDEAGIPQTGTLDAHWGTRYAFHGTGCSVMLAGGSIGWDFGHGGRFDGFSPSKLADFARSFGNRFGAYGDWHAVKAALDDAEARGVVHRRFLQAGDDLYYVVRPS
jgi:hypothetical protein